MGTPKCGDTQAANNSATPAAPIVWVQGKNRVALLTSWSVIIRMELYPFDGGRLTIRSNAMVENGWDNLLLVMGKRGTFGLLVLGLVLRYCIICLTLTIFALSFFFPTLYNICGQRSQGMTLRISCDLSIP